LGIEMRQNKNAQLANLGFTVNHTGPHAVNENTFHNTSRPVQPTAVRQLAYAQARNRQRSADVTMEGPYSNAEVQTRGTSYPTYLMSEPGSGVAASKGIGDRDSLRKSAPRRLVAVTKAQDNGTAV
jgi:hypothetical protein